MFMSHDVVLNYLYIHCNFPKSLIYVVVVCRTVQKANVRQPRALLSCVSSHYC